MTVTPITNAKANSYLQGTTKDNLADDTIVGYNLRANYNNEGGLANSVTYYVMTEKDILGYENDSDTDKGNDPTEWTDWGKDNSPKLKFTLPVNANDRSLPSINIFFMDPVNGRDEHDGFRVEHLGTPDERGGEGRQHERRSCFMLQ